MLAGRIALVTGGGSGIGRAVCSLFAKEGARVAVVDVNANSAADTKSTLTNPLDHISLEANVASSADISNIISKIKEVYKAPPCITVNAAGITRDQYALKMTEEAFDEVISVNLKGTFLINQAVGRAMVESKVQNGSIVNIASIVGKVGNIGQANYTASKAGVIGMTKTLSREYAKFDIRVNAVLPGFIETPMTDKVPEEIKQTIIMMIPMLRQGKPEEIAEACLFLASSRSSYVTGSTLEVTGGFAM